MKNFRLFIGWICLILLGSVIAGIIGFRFTNPTLTETQLFNKLWIIIFILLLLCAGVDWGFKK